MAYEQEAKRIVEAFRQPKEDLTIKIVSGSIKSVSENHSTAMVDLGSGSIRALNKSGDKLTVGESVWLGYIKSLADAVILFRAGLSKPGGVGEDLGHGNERFNDYTGNTVDFDIGSEGEYNTLKGHGNTIVGEADGNSIAGDSNRIAAGDNNSVAGSHNQVIGSDGSSNAVEGEYNIVSGVGNIVSGEYNVAGVMPKVPLWYLLSTMAAYYTGTADEKAGNLPAFMVAQDSYGSYDAGSSAVGRYNAVYEGSTAIGERNAAKKRSATVGYANAADLYSASIGQFNAAYNHSLAIGEYCSAGTSVEMSSNNEPCLSPPSSIMASIEQAGLGLHSAAIGSNVKNTSSYTFAFGRDITIYNRADYMLIVGLGLTASGLDCGAILGRYNDDTSWRPYQIGNGSSPTQRRNVFEFEDGYMYIEGSYNTFGADYAEYEEWLDGNPNDEDRIGHFVTYEGDKIRFTNATDDYILGVVSAMPSIIGDSDISYWRKKYERDIFWRPVLDAEGNPIVSKDYDPEKKYIPRSNRKEWSPVGTHGKLIVIDDGSCVEGGYCRPTDGGIATRAMTQNGAYRVLKRLDKTHIKIRLK